MEFTEVRMRSLGSSPVGEIFEGLTHNFYEVRDPAFSEKEKHFALLLERLIQRKDSVSELGEIEDLSDDFLDIFREEIISVVEINGLLERMPSKKIFLALKASLGGMLSQVSFVKDKPLFSEYVLHNSIGLKKLAFFSMDNDLEELMVNNLDSVFVFHRKFGMCRTNVSLEEKMFANLVHRIAFSVGKEFTAKDPLLDARLPDGSRVNATSSDVSPRGNSLTIRKFAPVPLTMLDLIENNTITSEAAAFMWVMTEGLGLTPQNMLVTGGTASGKTTLLNVLANFARLSDRVVSIEDTLEISLLERDNWVALEAQHSRDCEISMNDLLKNSLRMRPDRIIVGEVRGPEALTLFSAMDSGHAGCLGTIHANDSREAIIKLQERPLEVPQAMLPLVDLIIVMQRHYSKEKGLYRRVVQISEVSRMESKVLLTNVYEYDDNLDKLKRTEVPSHIIEEVARKNSVDKNTLKMEIESRKLILEWMMAKGIRAPREVLEVIQSYYYNPEKVKAAIYSSR